MDYKYKSKYIKYKTKYLDLKKQQGGLSFFGKSAQKPASTPFDSIEENKFYILYYNVNDNFQDTELIQNCQTYNNDIKACTLNQGFNIVRSSDGYEGRTLNNLNDYFKNDYFIEKNIKLDNIIIKQRNSVEYILDINTKDNERKLINDEDLIKKLQNEELKKIYNRAIIFIKKNNKFHLLLVYKFD